MEKNKKINKQGDFYLAPESTAQKSGDILLTSCRLFSSDPCQTMKYRIVTERLTAIYSQIRLHVIGCLTGPKSGQLGPNKPFLFILN